MNDKEFSLLSTAEAAVYLGIKPHNVNYHVRAGNLAAKTISGVRFFWKADLDHFLANRRPQGRQRATSTSSTYNISEVVEILGVSRARVYTLNEQKSWRVGRGLYDKKKIDLYKESRDLKEAEKC